MHHVTLNGFYAPEMTVAAADVFLQEELYDKMCGTEGKPIVNCIRHTHIDMEWQWTRYQTIEKKISWNDTNKMPVDTFLWKGIDGTEIFTNFITTQQYQKVPANRTAPFI